MLINNLINLENLIYFKRKASLFAAKGLSYHFTYGRWRLGRWLGLQSIDRTLLDDHRFFDQFDLERDGFDKIKQYVISRNYSLSKSYLYSYFQTKSTPRFFFNPQTINFQINQIADEQKQSTIHAADQICQRIFCFRQLEPVKFEHEIDWTYRPEGNTDWTWDLNRHSYFETLGRAYWYTGHEIYAQTFRDLLRDWLANNPADISHPNWSSIFEVAFRINTWIWAFYYFQSSETFDEETYFAFLKGLFIHGHFLDRNLEYHSQNNHLLLEAKSLAFIGILFPEFKQSTNWAKKGLNLVYQQLKMQICSDGVHAERSTHYHRVVSGEILELFILLENNNQPIPTEIIALFNYIVEFELWVTKPNGFIPLLSDSALHDVHIRFSAAIAGAFFLKRDDLKSIAPILDESNTWLLGPERIKTIVDVDNINTKFESRAFPDGGYFLMRSGMQGVDAAYLVFDCGPFGYHQDPNHGHADALSIELFVHGQTWLVDPGVYSTHLGSEWRHFFRGTHAHNTVVVDHQDQTILLDSRRVYRPAKTSLHAWISNDQFDFVDGSHHGYERFRDPITHRRQIFYVKPSYWVIVDILSGQGQHCYDLLFHLMPNAEITLEHHTVTAQMQDNPNTHFTMASLGSGSLQTDIITGATNPIQGWVSFYSGEKWAAPTIRHRQEGTAPVKFCTVVSSCTAGESCSAVRVSSPELTIQSAKTTGFNNANDDIGLTCLAVECDQYKDYFIIDCEKIYRYKAFSEYETDAQILFCRFDKHAGKLIKKIIYGGSELLYNGKPVTVFEYSPIKK